MLPPRTLQSVVKFWKARVLVISECLNSEKELMINTDPVANASILVKTTHSTRHLMLDLVPPCSARRCSWSLKT